jgi:hypothetical protein
VPILNRAPVGRAVEYDTRTPAEDVAAVVDVTFSLR